MALEKVLIQSNSAAGNHILVYDRSNTGALKHVQTVSTNGKGADLHGTSSDTLSSQGSLIYDPAHNLVFAVNAGSDTIAVLSFDANQQLHLKQVLSSSGVFPVSLTIHNDLVFVLNAAIGGSIQAYRVGPAPAHTVTLIPYAFRGLNMGTTLSSPFTDTPAQISFTPNGQHLIISSKGNTTKVNQMIVFSMLANGQPSITPQSSTTSHGAGPFGFTFDAAGHLVMTEVFSNDLSTYSINANGTLQHISSAATGAAPCWVERAGNHYYVANNGSSNITAFNIPASGVPSVVSTVSAGANSQPIDLTVTSDNKFLYLQQIPFSGTPTIEAYAIQASGSLTPLVPPSYPGVAGMEGIVAT